MLLAPLMLALSGANGSLEYFLEEVLAEAGMDTYEYGTDVTPLVKTLDNNKTLKITNFGKHCLIGSLYGMPMAWDEHGKCMAVTCSSKDDLEYSDMWLIKP